MTRTQSLLLLSLNACGARGAPSGAAEGELPTGQAVYEAYLAAVIVDAEAVAAIDSMKVGATMSMPAQGMEGRITLWWERPDHLLSEAEIPGIGLMQTGYDGDLGWSVDPMSGPRVLEGDELAMQRFQAESMGVDNMLDLWQSLENRGLVDFEGQQAWEVVAVAKALPDEQLLYFDPDTALQVGQVQKVATGMGKLKATSVMGDYQEANGALMARRVVSRTLGIEQVITFDEVEVNLDTLPDFGPPEAVRALMDE